MRNEYLTDITKREFFGGGVDQREACVFAGELVCMVDAFITAITKSSFICRAKYSGSFFVTHVTLDLHDLFSATLLLDFSL